ncbi:MAG TPA: hypothetical protein VFJ89_07100 [Nocardioides sp.]|nr:hypothetical protein [Nocardioides sp.]
MDPYEDIRRVLTRRKLWREESLQLVLTCLIVGGVYPRWGTRSTPTVRGVEFLRRLHVLVFGEDSSSPCHVFVDEFELPRRHEAERSGWPDWAVLWPDRVWMIELKTEAGSHRPDQLPHYLDLGAHHYPHAAIDLTYLTGLLDKPPPQVRAGQRYHHIVWTDVLPLIEEVWADDEPATGAYVQAARDLIASLGTPWADWRTGWMTQVARAIEASEPATTQDDLWELIVATAEDGEQRASDAHTDSGESLEDLRDRARELIIASPEGSATKRVVPWIWSSQTSGGQPLTSAGEALGAELRLSRYAKPRFTG